jgi:pimeloyl-ACP methyl ester carboxylesterase
MRLLQSPDQVLGFYLKLLGFRSRQIKIRSCSLHYFEKRHPQEKGTLVLVHGVGASSGHFAQVLNSFWKKGYSVLAPDLPGHGQSDDPAEYMGSECFYGLFRDWLNQVIPRPFVLFGNSLGGALSIRFTCENPSRVSQLVLVSPAGGFASEAEWNEFKAALTFQSIEDSKMFVPKIYHQPPFYLPLTYGPFLQAMTRKGLRQLIEDTKFETFTIDDALLRQMPPTLLIWGRSEKLFPKSHLERFKKLLPPSVLIEEPESIGHCPQLENPKWLENRVLTFLGN